MLKEFKLNDILEKADTKKIPLKKNECSVFKTKEYDIPARTATTQKQGLSCFVPRDKCTVLKNMISVSANGDYCAFYHDTDFTILQDSYALKGRGYELNETIALYLISAMKRTLGDRYNWNNKSGWEKIKNEVISLPTLTNPDNTPVIDPAHKYHPEGYIPDWEYMQDYIKELEQDYIKELEQYLIVTGLNDYKLTDKDREVLGQKIAERETNYQDRDNEDTICDGREVREFVLEDLFTSQNGDTDIKQSDINGKGYMVISSGITNNGVIGRTDIEAKIINKDTITVDMFGYSFYRDEPYKIVTHARVFTLEPKFDGMNLEIGNFIATSLKHLPKIYNYSNMCSWNKIKKDKIGLPIQLSPDNTPVLDPTRQYHPDGYIPDWEYMEKYIRAIEKIVIKDVVKYKDEAIRKMKEVTEWK